MNAKKALCFYFALLAGSVGLGIERAQAHCDTMDGPVVVDAKAALEALDVQRVLKWVKAEHEAEIQSAFNKTLAVRAKGPDARELADMYFFETLVRIHRAGEGAPYRGLKPAGTDPGPAVTAADKALQTGSVDELAKRIGKHAEAGVRERFAHALETKGHVDDDTGAGRKFVAAYVRFVHYVERLHNAIAGQEHHHAKASEQSESVVDGLAACGHHD